MNTESTPLVYLSPQEGRRLIWWQRGQRIAAGVTSAALYTLGAEVVRIAVGAPQLTPSDAEIYYIATSALGLASGIAADMGVIRGMNCKYRAIRFLTTLVLGNGPNIAALAIAGSSASQSHIIVKGQDLAHGSFYWPYVGVATGVSLLVSGILYLRGTLDLHEPPEEEV